jgi:DNA-binding beta-propeller fold protein YncE
MKMKKFMCIAFVLVFCFVLQVKADKPIGVVANNNTNSFHLIDPATQQLSLNIFRKGQLGSYGGGLFDVVITPNGKTAIISNFGDSRIYFIDISEGFIDPSIPLTEEEIGKKLPILGYTDIPFFAEDMDVTSDGKYVLVTDGGFSPRCAVVDIASMTLVMNNNLKTNQANAVAISPDGKTVLFADYFGSMIHAYSLGDGGVLTFLETYYLDYMRPVNVTISPDGKTVIAAISNRYDFPVFSMNSKGELNYKGAVATPTKGAQSVVFGKDGTKAYYLGNSTNYGAQVHVLDVSGAGQVRYNSSIELSIPRGTSQLFGVDTIAVDPSGNYLYVANPTISGGVVELTVIDLTTNTEVNQLPCNGIPCGIAFGTITE